MISACLLCALLAAAPTPKPAPAAPPPRPAAKPAVDVPLPPPPVLQPRPAPQAAPEVLKVGPPAAAPRARQALRLAMPDVKVSGELPPRQLAVLESSLLAEVRKLEGVSAIGMGEIREMLSFEYQRQMMGCQADEACLAEIGGALGTDELVQASVIIEGQTANLSLKRINMRTARVAGAHTRRLARAGGEELLGAVGPAIQELFPERALRAGFTRGVDKAVALRLNPPPLPRWAFFATASAALVAGVAGAGMGYLSRDARTQYDRLARQSLTESVPGAQLRDLEQIARSRASSANLLLGVAGGLALVGGVEALFTDWHGYRAQVDVGPGTAAVKVGGTF